MSVYRCNVCKFRYDEWVGDTKNGVEPGVPFSRLAGSVCSNCGLQGGRHEELDEIKYAGLEATYYDQFAGKAGIAFYRDWLLGFGDNISVLELGVGTGRIAVELARNGIAVVGVDWSTDMLRLAEKKKRHVLKEREHLLELVEGNARELDLDWTFTHVLLPEGIFQQAVSRRAQRQFLRTVRAHLREEGIVAIDILLPPMHDSWSVLRRKHVFPDRMVYQRVEGETSLVRQAFRYILTYETFLDQVEQPRYRVEREMALLLPGELCLLLEAEGFEVLELHEKHQTESAGKAVEGFAMDRWQHGGYPFASVGNSDCAASRYTITAKKVRYLL
ncbi:methyltransferase domain-containing protein [Brevibacillus sp. TJ4]|uniref:methyltransferase domain-containing protein n=1 Tax=Brevibacillus sp. TJ4 TaxID=3234853 RepID=UPI0037D6B16B